MDVNSPLSTAQVPPQYLKAAMLTGSTPLKALASDPRLSYNLYIPTSHYNPDPNHSSIQDEDPHPSYKLPRIPLVITIHGSGRDVGSCRRRLISLADSDRFAILAPLFPTGLDHELDLDSYKLLRSKTLRSDLALLDMVSEVRVRYPGIDTKKFFLVGFSGGGQFVQRFLLVHPEKVIAASIGAPGRVTRWDKTAKWPRGIADVKDVFEQGCLEEQLELLTKVQAVQMVIGGDDVQVPGEKFNEWAAKMYADEPQSATLEPMKTPRVATLRALHEEWKALGIQSTFEIVEGVKHDSEGIHPAIELFLRSWIKDWWSAKTPC